MQDRDIAEVWALEAAYWRHVRESDVKGYLSLWHEDFIGWPCTAGSRHPVRKDAAGAWIEGIREQQLRLSVALRREGIQGFGGVVVVHYSTPVITEHLDGRITGKDQPYKFTHTWLKVGSTWQIIGGMCAPLSSAPGA
ncbi:MAG TPA: nuclear transport factor 2 family protein [Gammaproteobacteria bacterium]|jgi:ketosteroid isomerase-like protein|nr:nuclear transport factor 2 family protein [Gammaproteobacteria bacterium]